ncbi:reverse transcriptase [Gossypium australe]|uniref:Reverse transcriptase n=1 Tax=Gossypium australe TaxID=47621 RepID=A0A5B6W5G6_9ROSI|nr:reverse transcriptase [Gossypium australe]
METKLDQKRMERVRRRCGFTNGIEMEAEGSRGGLCLAWKGDIDVSVKSFYGSPYLKDRNSAWDLLRRLSQGNLQPWLVAGDFNEILFGFEKNGGGQRDQRGMDAFRDTLEDCQLMDIGYSGSWYTWERGNLPETNIRERLDRGVANNKWMMLFPTGSV